MPQIGVLAFILTLLAWAAFIPVAKAPRLRGTMWPLWMLQSAALLLAGVALAHPPVDFSAPQIMAIAALVSVAAFDLVFFTVLRMPRSAGRPEVGKALPPLSFIGEDGQALAPGDFSGRGPLLLVFYRGFW